MSLLLLAGVADAATYDPDLQWRTITTEHFHVHFHQGVEQVADEFSVVVEDVFRTMTEEVRWTPRGRTDVVLVDRTDDANGFATAVPYNAITIYVTAPTEDSTLNLYEDWSTAIFTHELTHVLHLETNHGIVSLARAVVGRVASTNSVSPAWMVEGFATFQETRHTPGGRGRASWPDMLKRTAVLEDAFPPLGNLDGFQPNPPAGNLRYLWGQDFIQYVADHTGEDTWTKWVHTYGGWFPFWLPTKRVFGRQLVPLYYDWKRESYDRYLAQADAIVREGRTQGRVVSDPAASCVAPAFSPDGEKLVWSCYDLRTGSALWMADGDGFGREVLQQDFGAGYFTWRADSEAFSFSLVHVVNQFNVWDDVYLFDLKGRAVSALTQGARARDPDFSPDGSRLLYVTNRAQNNQLEVMTVDRRRDRLTENTDHTQYSTPRFSPDGEVVALSVWQDGRRDLWLYDPDGEPVRRLTEDAAIDADPVWSADGRWLFFTSDRSGVPNVYAIETATERLWQVTNVLTGATKPSLHPSGKRMAYMEYTQDGWDIVVYDLDPATWRDRGSLTRPLRYGTPITELTGGPPPEQVARFEPTPGEEERRGFLRPVDPWVTAVAQQSDAIDTFEDVSVKDAFGEEEDYPFRIEPHRYSPFRTLLPRYVLPYFQTTPFTPGRTFAATCLDRSAPDTRRGTLLTGRSYLCPGLLGSLSTSGTDVLRRYGWAASVNYRTDAEYLGGGASVTINRFLPVYTFGAYTGANWQGPLYVTDPANLVDEDGELQVFETLDSYWEKRSSAYAVVSWPYRLRTTLFAQYQFTERSPLDPLGENVYTPALPLVGYVGALSGGWRYSWSQPTAYAISAEDGQVFSLVGSLLHPWLGTFVRDFESGTYQPFTQVQLTSEVRRYWVNPWIANHVLAARAAGGITFGASDFLGNYQLGGAVGDSGFLVTPDEYRMVRGYPFGYQIGDLYWLGAVEYRFPLWRVERGLGTVPVYGRTLSGSVFVDTGSAFNSPSLATGVPSTAQDVFEAAIAAPMVGVGAEVVWRAVIAYGLGIQGRVGYAIGLTGDGFQPTDGLDPLYLQLGGSF